MSVEDSWEVIHDWLAFHHPHLLGSLRGPADPSEFRGLEERIGHTLPDAFKHSYLIHDGSDSPTRLAGPLIGLRLMSLNAIGRQWKSWAEIADDEELVEEMSEDRRSHPPGAVKPLYANRNWVPFAGDGIHYVGLDFDPDEKGIPGQVINAGRDDVTLHVIANSFEEFLAFVAAQFTAGRVCVSASDDSDPPRWLATAGGQHDLITGLPFLLGLKPWPG
jgi:cell wall assembly regulator SMI1